MTGVRPLTAAELTAWRTFLRAHGAVVRRLDADLERERGLSLADYEVLVHLSDDPDRRLRMSDLAGRVLLSRSGLTRLVDRLERAGLVRRERCPNDARGTFAVLTDGGWRRLEDAYPTHLRGVRDYVIDELSAAELSTLHQLLQRVACRAGSGG